MKTMHSYVFHISSRPLKKEEWPTDDVILSNIQDSRGVNAVDYVEALSGVERSKVITNLVCKWLPRELFGANADGSFTYIGGLDEWVQNTYIPTIKSLAALVNPNKVFSIGTGSAYQVEKYIKNPFDLESIFIEDEGFGILSGAMHSGAFLECVVKFLSPGDRIYIGAVYDYHF